MIAAATLVAGPKVQEAILAEPKVTAVVVLEAISSPEKLLDRSHSGIRGV